MGEAHVDGISADVGVLGRMDTSEVLVLDEDWAVCRGQRSEGERTPQVLAGRVIAEVYGFGLEDDVAVGCRGVHALVEFAGVERSVMEIADGELDSVRNRWL